ncbi:hypothetical protein EVAR_12302_1 [Eumeta japonica]|uniref:Uncharacterized protein n=1 Tax=Eumeta variegata TaxID=151549 RepID=A0A4C1TU97_EUMVA|nr:hypothetical protein EVAR_12302_1 [Eumeta japonica]
MSSKPLPHGDSNSRRDDIDGVKISVVSVYEATHRRPSASYSTTAVNSKQLVSPSFSLLGSEDIYNKVQRLLALLRSKRKLEPPKYMRSPPLMNTRDSEGVISALPTSWIGLRYLMEEGVG